MVKIKVENLSNIETAEDIQPIKEESASDNEVEEPKQTKKTQPQKLVSCPNCNKEMLQKTFRYYHSLKCKPVTVDSPPVVERPEKIEVTFDVGRPIQKGEKIQRLISRAF